MTRSAIRHTLSALAAVALVSAFSGNPASAQEDLKSIMAGVKAHNSQEDLKSIMGGVKAHVIREQRSLAAQQSPASTGGFRPNSLRIGTGNFSELIGNLTRISGNEVANIALSDAIPLRCESSPYGIFGKDTPRSGCHG